MCTLGDVGAPDKRFLHTLDSLSRWARTATSFRCAQTATLLEFHVQFTNCFVCRWFCVVHDPKPPFHRHNWLSFGKFQDTERFLIHCERHFSSRLLPSGGNCKYTKAPITKKKNVREFLYSLICSFLPCRSWLLRSQVRKFRRDLWITLYIYTGCPGRNVPDFGRVFFMLKYTDITENNYVQNWTVTEIMAREKCGLLAGPRTVPVSWQSYPCPPLSVESINSSSAQAIVYRNAR